MATIKLDINANSKNLTDNLDGMIYDLTANGIEIRSKSDYFPMPWDAACYIEDGFFIIDGDLGQQGSHRGWAKVGIPLDRVKNYLEISVTTDSQESVDELTDIFTEYGWL